MATILLDVNKRVRCKPATVTEQCTQFFVAGRGERRIQEDDVVLPAECPLSQKLVGIMLMNSGVRVSQRLHIRPQLCSGAGRHLDEVRMRRASGQRFEAQRAGSGKQIEATGAFDNRREPVKQRLANPVGGRPKPWLVCNRQDTTAPFSRYNTQPSWW